MLRFSSQTIHGIMFPDGRLRQTFFFSIFFSRHSSSKYSHFIFQAPIIQKMDSAIYQIKSYPVDKYYDKQLQYPFVSDLSGRFRYPPFEQLQGSRCTFSFQIKAGKKNWVLSFISSILCSLVDEKSFYLGRFFFRSDQGRKEKKFFNLTRKFLAFSKSATLLNLFFHPLLQPRKSFTLSCLKSFLSPYDELRKFLDCISNDVYQWKETPKWFSSN